MLVCLLSDFPVRLWFYINLNNNNLNDNQNYEKIEFSFYSKGKLIEVHLDFVLK